MSLRPRAKAFIEFMALHAGCCWAYALLHWQSSDSVQFLCYSTVAMLASALKVTLPGIDGTMSVNFLFILLGVMEMSFPETLVLGCAAVLVQCYWKPSRRLHPILIIFNTLQLAVAITAAYG